MSLPRAVVAGTLVGAVAALGLYSTMGPDDLGRAAVPAPPTFAAVPTPTVTQLADCIPPAQLKAGACVTVKPGPTVTVPPPRTSTPTTAQRTAPAPRTTTDAQEPEPGDDGGGTDEEDDHDRGEPDD